MSATTSSLTADRRWSVALTASTCVSAVINGGALAVYLLDQANPWLVGAGQASLLVTLVTWLRVILLRSVRPSLNMWLLPLAASTLVALYLTLATPS